MNSEPGYGLPWRLGASLPADLIAPAGTLSATGEPIVEGDLNATAAEGTLSATGTVRVVGSMNAQFPAATLQIVVPKYYPSRQPATPGAGLPWLLGFVSGGDLIAPAATLAGDGEIVSYLHVEVSDSASVSDQILVEKVFPADAVTLTDTVQAGLSRSVEASDTCTLTDLATTNVSYNVNGGDSVAVTDDLIVTGALTYSVFVNDTVSLTDQALHAGAFSIDLVDSVGLTDQASYAGSYGVVVADAISSADSVLVEGAFSLSVAINETLILTDEVDRGATYGIHLDEAPLGVGDALFQGLAFDRNLSDVLEIEDSDLLVETAIFFDVVSLSDGVLRDALYTRSASEDLGVGDTITLEASFERLPAEELSIEDVAIKALAYGRVLSDTAVTPDGCTPDTSYRRFVDDVVAVSEETVVSLDMLVLLEMPLDLTEAVERSTHSHRILGDTVGFDDATTCAITYQKTVVDVVGAIADSLHVDLEKSRKAEDVISVVEFARTEETYARASQDFCVVADWTVGEILKFKVPPGLGQRRVLDLQSLGRDGLYLRFESSLVPAFIFYTLYQMDRGAPVAVGGRRRPAVGPYGEYYVTNADGEINQPGKWLVRWEVWETLTSSAKIAEQFFEVLPTPVPAILTSQAVKYGWA